jgi:pyruvate/2-oxoglutarate dehydrogenase complex dihydrolipoamide acyltransferase (E2) component
MVPQIQTINGGDVFDSLVEKRQVASPAVQPPMDRLTFPRQWRVRLEYDDGIIDGSAASAFLYRFRYYIESPTQLIL